MTDSRLKDATNSILNNLVTALTTAGIDVPEKRYPHTGQVSQDFVGDKCAEQFVVSWLGSAGGMVEAGGGATPPIKCAMPITHNFGIYLFRCVPTIKGVQSQSIRFPSAAELKASSDEIQVDAMTLGRVLVDLVLSDSLIDNKLDIVGINSILPVGPGGALGGTVMTIRATVL